MPNLKIKSKQYLFKNKLNIRRKSKGQLLKESFFMSIIGFFILLINYFNPNKVELIISFKKNLYGIFNNLLEIIFYSFEIVIVILICVSLLFSIFLFAGSFNRLVKVFLSKSRKIRIR